MAYGHELRRPRYGVSDAMKPQRVSSSFGFDSHEPASAYGIHRHHVRNTSLHPHRSVRHATSNGHHHHHQST